jgi:hypothetical protein
MPMEYARRPDLETKFWLAIGGRSRHRRGSAGPQKLRAAAGEFG